MIKLKPRTRIILLSVISILIVVIIVLGITYSFMRANIPSSSITEVSLSSCAKIALEDGGVSINLNNTSPISKNRALETTPYTFTISSSCDGGVGFNLYLATLNTNTLDANNIHYIITNHGSKDIITEGILGEATDALSEFTADDQNQLNIGINGTFETIYKIYSNGIHIGEDQEFDLYLYVDENVNAAETMNKTFTVGVATKSYDYSFATINDVVINEITSNSITLTVNATAGASSIQTYYYSNDGGASYVGSSSNTYTFTGLNKETEYAIKAYTLDNEGYQSASYSINVSTLDYTLADVCPDGGNLSSCFQTYNTTYGDGTGGLYYHDGIGTYTNADQEDGDNSYRYSGANPNNYVCFGSSAATCPEENLYRIIGVFDEEHTGEYKAKLIKADYVTSEMLGTDGRDYYGTTEYVSFYYRGNMDANTIAVYKWNDDTSVNRYGSNNWTTSELNKINLNTNYWNYLGATWQNLIASTTWHLGGLLSNTTAIIEYHYKAKELYDGERNNAGYEDNPTTYEDEIGLMYVSDYGYAASPENWSISLGDYDSDTNRNNNWIYMGLTEWTITPYASKVYTIFFIDSDGEQDDRSADSGYSVRPVFYLNSNVEFASGYGTLSDPYRLVV